ncbi:PREDICTED: protein ENHANCED DISEASE RESISTANCE 4-like isoform X2 [Lupinus angustifolius]|uniref:protein ENHANCED DISEASE RESISTANCE 4-like isoform X2 n=1 Tax=Lupinus angustifolius TaxID=3871 RepID=UPI00092E3448|nr:PREDICTED: protein ENHANCED DISEASE RESISTANCE 4-like isoform X2 [Lupinus angustifolius]
MSAEPSPKPRLVLCPKCRKVLPEPPDVDLYQCGGCGKILQAKKQKNRAVNSESITHRTVASPTNSLDLVPDHKQHSSGEQLVIPQDNGLRQKATISSSGNGEQLVIPQENSLRGKAISSSGECSSDGNGGKGLVENGECHGEQLAISPHNGVKENVTSSFSGECSVTSVDENGGRGQIENGEGCGEQLVISHEDGLRGKAANSSTGESSTDGNGECNREQLRRSGLSDEELENKMDIYKLLHIRRVSGESYSNEQTRSEIEASSELKADNSVENANNANLQLEGEELSNGNMPLEGAGEELGCALDKEGTNNEKSALDLVKSEVNITGSDLEGAEELNNGNLLPEGAKQELIFELNREGVNNDKSAPVGANSEVEITGSNKAAEEINNGNLLEGAKTEVDITGSASTAKRSSHEKFIYQKGSISQSSPAKLEEGTSSNRVSSPNQQWKQAQKSIHHSFDSVTSVDIFDTTNIMNPSSELTGALEEMRRSSTTRSSHAYEGSVSSNDREDERFCSQQLDSFENNYTVANGVSEGRFRKGKGLVNSMLYGDLDTQQESFLPNGKHHVLKDNRGIQNEVQETTRHGHPHWTRTRREEFPPKIPFHQSGSQSGYESGSPSNQTHDGLYCSSSFLSLDSLDNPDQEKMELLRMIYKLQDQLNRTSYANGETNGRFPTGVSYKGNHVSTNHGHGLHEGRFYHGYDFPRCDGGCDHGTNHHRSPNFSRPYVSGVASSKDHTDYSCVHCYPQEWQRSAELPLTVPFQHEEIYKSHLDQNYCPSHCAYPSSPQCVMPSKLLYVHETKSGDQMHGVPEVMKYIRKKQNLTMRHYRPIAGGAPFVTCHKCLNLLQLPTDFLIFRRAFHQLKCGSCSEVLKFSLQNRSHIVSYAPNAIVPSSGDLDDQNEVINSNSLHSESHANYYHSSHADPISYSDDFGHSISKSHSSESDLVSTTPFHPLHGLKNDNPSVSHGTLEPITKNERIASIGPSTSEDIVETDELDMDSSNMSSEMEAQSAPRSSALHKLMGYSSPIHVIRGIQSIVEGK